MSLLVLSRPYLKEDLYMYLALSDHAISSVLLRQNDGVQRPVYYLVDSKTRYLLLEKAVLALVHTARKRPHYFQPHIVWVLTEHPLQSLLRRLDFTRWIAKWGTRLEMFNIHYKPRNAIKGQALADFIMNFTPKSKVSIGVFQVMTRKWRIYVDGASNTRGSGIRIVMVSPEGVRLERSLRLGFCASNNKVESEALISGL
ncbi:uncharacterized protein LOC142625069 [Castanea sativa]|uniref:uncharacterized protein LOC142625069 n=1 Tax=Castanea sativa TaxID=21020 RepID=UPI003F649F7A